MSDQLEIKNNLLQQCMDYVHVRLYNIQKVIDEIQESLLSETKSSAGDKHETGRAMLQLEREKAGNQLAEIQKLQETLAKIDISKNHVKIGLGSVVFTSNGNYFIAISAGELMIENQRVYAISQHSPIGQMLVSKQVGDRVDFRDQTFKIEQVI